MRRSPAVNIALWIGLLGLLTACGSAPGAPAARETAAPQGAPLDIALVAPPGFRISLYARDLGEARMIAFDDQGVPYVTLMNRGTELGGKVVALPDRDRNGIAEEVVTTLEQLDRPHGLVWHDGAMYVSEPSRISRIIDDNKDLRADRSEVVVENIPSRDDHWARPFVFEPDGNIVVAVGSTCDACQEGDKSRAAVHRYQPGGERLAIVARGLRSVVGLAWRPGTNELWATNHGRDNLGPDLPPDTVIKVEEGKHYGWPYCYGNRVVDQQVLNDPSIVTHDRSPKDLFCQTEVSSPALLLPAHVAPLGLAFYDGAQFPEAMRGGLFMAWHGAFDFSTTGGYRVAFAPIENGQIQPSQDFVTGWLKPDGTGWLARPTGVTVGPDGSLYICEDVNGNIYRVEYVGTP